jgi:hypothetical protein
VYHPPKYYKQAWESYSYGLFFTDDPDRVPFNHWQYLRNDMLARYSQSWQGGGYGAMQLGTFIELQKWTYIGEPVTEGDTSPGPTIDPYPVGPIVLVPY